MEKLSAKERIIYRFILNEKRVYRYCYNRFLLCGVDLAQIRRVIPRIKNFYGWCAEWPKEGEKLEKLAEEALSQGNIYSARSLFQEAAACFHIGQHIYFIDIEQKNKAQEKARENYKRAIELYDEKERPIRLEIPFRGTVIPGYLRLTGQPNRPLIIQINGLDNTKALCEIRRVLKKEELLALGECLIDPDYTRRKTEIAWCRDAGFELVGGLWQRLFLCAYV